MPPVNLLFILADDLGYADLGCTGSRSARPVSPHLDRLAAQGMRFTHGYANSPVCSPTRFALMTGRWQYRLRGGAEEPLTPGAQGSELMGLPPDHPTFPSLLKASGYRTGLVGKWHLGYPPHFGPGKSGYAHFFGMLSGGVDYFTHADSRGNPDLWSGAERVRSDAYLTDVLSDAAIDFLRGTPVQQPFCLSVHYTAPHWPWETRDDRAESARIQRALSHVDGGSVETYHRMIHHMDEGIGRILAALDDSGRAGDTLVVFTSDNGGERFSDNWPFVGQKMDLLEGGIRVPLLARWPGRIAPGTVTDTPAITMDWAATLLAAAGVREDAACPMDGVSLLPLFADPAWSPARALYWRMAHRQQRALREGAWKYLSMDGREFLYDLAADPRERADLGRRHPARLERMRQAWLRWASEMPGIPDDVRVTLVPGMDDLARPTH